MYVDGCFHTDLGPKACIVSFSVSIPSMRLLHVNMKLTYFGSVRNGVQCQYSVPGYEVVRTCSKRKYQRQNYQILPNEMYLTHDYDILFSSLVSLEFYINIRSVCLMYFSVKILKNCKKSMAFSTQIISASHALKKYNS